MIGTKLGSYDITAQIGEGGMGIPDGEPSRFTFGPAPGRQYPIWSPDGREIAYATQDLAGLPVYELRRRRADRSGGEETLASGKEPFYP